MGNTVFDSCNKDTFNHWTWSYPFVFNVTIGNAY